MRGFILAISTLLAGIVSVSAQTAGELPTCAAGCVTSLLPDCCGGDPRCICATASFIDNIACCVYQACNATYQQAALDFAHTFCDPEGLGDVLPASAGCDPITRTLTPTGGCETSATTTVTLTSTPSDTEGTSSPTGTESSVPADVSSATEGLGSLTVSPTPGGSTAGTAGGASATPDSGNRVQVGLGAVGAGMLGLAALL